MQIEANVQMDYAMYKKFFVFNMHKGRQFFNPLILSIVCGILTFWILVLYILMKDSTLLVFIVCLFFVQILNVWMIFVVPKLYYKSAAKLLNGKTYYVFKDEDFSVQLKNDTASGASRMQYSGIHKVYETKDTTYIYISNMQAYVLPKTSFTLGAPMNLRTLLQEKLGQKRYIVCYKE